MLRLGCDRAVSVTVSVLRFCIIVVFTVQATTYIYTLSLLDALPIFSQDFKFLLSSNELEMICESISKNLSITSNQKVLESTLGLISPVSTSSMLRTATVVPASTISEVSFADSPRVPKKPEGFA